MSGQSVSNRAVSAIQSSVRDVRRLASRYRAARAPFGLALLYHRVAQVGVDPWDLCVTPKNFAAQMAVLKGIGTCMKFSDFAESCGRGNSNSLAVTFDDGYQDNLTNALPVLEAHQVPATVFVTSRTIGSERPFWWDALCQVFLTSRDLPQTLSLLFNGKLKTWHFRDNGKAARSKAQRDIWKALLTLEPDEVDHIVRIILAWAGPECRGDTEAHPMTRDELRELAHSDLIEIGGHTANHRPLSMISDEACTEEIAVGRADLIDWLGCDVTSFSYPYGKHNARTVEMVRQAGFKYACTVVEDITTMQSDLLRIPRIQVKNWSAIEFERQLKTFTGVYAKAQS